MMKRTVRAAGWFLALALSAATVTVASDGPKKIIFDGDPGVDDTMAIFFALRSPKIDVVGITTVFGNVTTDQATTNALRLIEMAGVEIPVAHGADHPLVKERRSPPTFVHGADGLGEVDSPPPAGAPIDQSAARFIVEMARRHPGEITLVPVGPLTNIALALAIEPRLPELVREVILMGGAARVAGNVTPVAEANIFGDPHAADIVFRAPWKVTMVGLDVTTRVRMTDDVLERIAEANPRLGGFIYSITRFYKKFYESRGVTGGFYVHDPSAIAFVVDPSLFETEASRVRVAAEGLAAGQTIVTSSTPPDHFGPWHDAADARVCTGVDAERLLELYEETLSR